MSFRLVMLQVFSDSPMGTWPGLTQSRLAVRSWLAGLRRVATLGLLGLGGVAPLFAEGSAGGHLTVPEGTTLADIRVVLVPQEAKLSRRSVKPNKKGEFFFGLVPDGRYTVALEGTTLVPHTVRIQVTDQETRKDVLNYSGNAPSQPTPFDVNINLKVVYDIVLGPAEESPAARNAAAESLQAVPALLQSGDYTGALERLDTALAKTPDDAAANYYRAFALFKLENFPAARAAIRRTLEIKPDQQNAHWLSGAILASEGKKAEAIPEFRKEIAQPGTEPATVLNSWINIGVLEREVGSRERAIEAFEKVIELDSAQAEAYSYLANLYMAAGQAEKAAEIAARSRTAGAEDPTAVFNLGANYWNSKEYVKAEQYFRRATELDPKFVQAWKSLGYALVNLGRTEEASSALRRYLELAPQAEDAGETRELLEALGGS